jgi:hypothetical protein
MVNPRFGPTTGVVEWPLRLDWSEQGRYDLSDPCQRNRKVRSLWESRFPTLPRVA